MPISTAVLQVQHVHGMSAAGNRGKQGRLCVCCQASWRFVAVRNVVFPRSVQIFCSYLLCEMRGLIKANCLVGFMSTRGRNEVGCIHVVAPGSNKKANSQQFSL